MLFPVHYDSVKWKQCKSNHFLDAFVVVGDDIKTALRSTKTVSKVAESEQILKQ